MARDRKWWRRLLGLPEPVTEAARPEATAYLMLARGRNGEALGLTIASSTALARNGSVERWERAPRPYAEVSASTLEQAQAEILRRIILDAEPWPEALAPLVQELLVVKQGTPHRRVAPADQRSRDIDVISDAIAVPLTQWPTRKLARVAAAIRQYEAGREFGDCDQTMEPEQ